MLHLLLGRDWTANRDALLTRISKDVKNRQGGRILMVPELISHETERRLCAAAGDTASRYAEVLSFTRLARRVTESVGMAAEESLDNGGRVVAMAAAARQLHSRLKAYAPVETRPEFLTGMIDAVDEFKRCCISPEDLLEAAKATEGSLSQKLEELALILESYDALCAQGKRDPRDRETQLLEQLEDSDFAREHVFYIDGFPDFTRQHLAILEHLIIHSPSVTVSLNCDRADSPLLAFEKAGDTASRLLRIAKSVGVEIRIENIGESNRKLTQLREKLFQGKVDDSALEGTVSVFRADAPFDECYAAADRIRELIQNGARCRDILVVCCDLPGYQPLVELAFHRCCIPVYLAGVEDIQRKSVIATVLSAMEAALEGFEQRSVFRYLRSLFSPVDPDVCDHLENYAVIWGIRGKGWLETWKNHPNGLSGVWNAQWEEQLQILNNARELAMGPLARLRNGFRDARNLREQVLSLYGFLEDIQLEKRLDDLARKLDEEGDNRSAQILSQLWEILLGAMEQLHDVLGETVWDTEVFCRLFRLLLSQYDVGTIPPVLDAVQVGAVSALRCHQQKHLILLGCQEGNLPGYSGSSGILTDQERVTLRELGVPLTGGAMEGIQAEFAEIYGVFCGAMESATLYYSGTQPSFVTRRLARMAGCEQELPPSLGSALADPFDAAAYFARWDGRDAAERAGVGEAYDSVCRRRSYALGNVERRNLDKLYGAVLNLSASQVDRQAECRFSYFMKYGLRAAERKEATVDPAEFGSYVHAVLEKTARHVRDLGGFPQVSLEETLEIADRYSEEYAAERFSQLDSQRLSYLFRRNTQELRMVVEELWEELQSSSFQPVDFELSFGMGDGLPPITVPTDKMNAILRGLVDRVDAWDNGHTSYYRVVDYKTGKKDFDYCDIFNGVGLQMLLYLFALQESGTAVVGAHPIPAGVQYFPARVPYVSADGCLEGELLEKERGKDQKRKGLLLRDREVLRAMEPEEPPRRLSYKLDKDGQLAGDLADREQMKLLKGYVYRLLGRIVEEIASGDVTPNPYTRGSSHSACTFCPYGPVCHEADGPNKRNYKTMTAQRFWEELEKEMNAHG